MTGTRRTAAELELLFADNVTGDISAQDARDLIASIKSHHGAFSWVIDNVVATVISVIGTYVKAAGPITNPGYISNDVIVIDPNIPNRFTYVDTNIANQHVAVKYTVSIKTGNNQLIHLAPAINGVVQEEWEQLVLSTGVNDPASVSVSGHLVLQPGDYVELYMANLTSTADVTVASGSASLKAYFE